MNSRTALSIALAPLILGGCSFFGFGAPPETQTPAATPDNPAYAHCVQNGGTYAERKGSGGGKIGYCAFDDGTECEAWAFYHALCAAGKIQVKADEEVPTAKPTPVAPQPAPAETKPAQAVTNSSITVTSPQENAQLSSPVEISGTTTLSGGTLTVAFTNTAGKEIFSVPISIRSGAFKGKVSYEFSSTKEGYIEMYQAGTDGSKDHLVRIPVKY